MRENREEDTQRRLNGIDVIRELFKGYSSSEIADWMIDNGFWSPIAPSSAAARVRSCCDPDKAEFWKFSELVAWAEATDRRVLADYVCDRTPSLDRPRVRGEISDELRAALEELDQVERQRNQAIERVLAAQQNEPAEPYTGEAFGTPASVRQVRFKRSGSEDDGG